MYWKWEFGEADGSNFVFNLLNSLNIYLNRRSSSVYFMHLCIQISGGKKCAVKQVRQFNGSHLLAIQRCNDSIWRYCNSVQRLEKTNERTSSPLLNLSNSKFNYLPCFLYGTPIVWCDYQHNWDRWVLMLNNRSILMSIALYTK